MEVTVNIDDIELDVIYEIEPADATVGINSNQVVIQSITHKGQDIYDILGIWVIEQIETTLMGYANE